MLLMLGAYLLRRLDWMQRPRCNMVGRPNHRQPYVFRPYVVRAKIPGEARRFDLTAFAETIGMPPRATFLLLLTFPLVLHDRYPLSIVDSTKDRKCRGWSGNRGFGGDFFENVN